jgi:hypothetical protein
MPVVSILGSFKFGADIPRVNGFGRTPLATAIILAVVVNRAFAVRTVPGDFVLEKLDRMPAGFAGHVENGLRPPFVCIVAGAFAHYLPPLVRRTAYLRIS